jgi:hypothetical protein
VEFLEDKRFGQVIIRAFFKALDAVGSLVLCREKDNRCLPISETNLLHDLKAVYFRQHHVNNHHIEVLFLTVLDGFAAVRRRYHLIALNFKIEFYGFTDVLFVFYQ